MKVGYNMGRHYCVVKDCGSTNVECSLFGFPKNCSPEWIDVVKRPGWSPTKYSRICEKHFSPHHIDPTLSVPYEIKPCIMTVNVLNGTSVLEMGCTVAGLGSSIALISLHITIK